MKSKYATKDHEHKYLRQIDYWMLFIMVMVLFIGTALNLNRLDNKINTLEESQHPNLCRDKIYILPDGEHKTTYCSNNNSYTIDKPFKCGDVYYGDYDTYKQICDWDKMEDELE